MARDIVHGVNAVREALAAEGRVTRLYLAREQRVRDADALIAQARAARVPFDFVPLAKLNAMTGPHEHQGVAARVSPAAFTPLSACLAACPEHAVLLALDQVQHPKNLGMILRSAAGAGASGVLLPARGGALPDETVIRASAGMAFHVPLVACPNLGQALRTVRDAGFWIYALDAEEGADVFAMDWPKRVALVLGNERRGVRPGVAKACDGRVRIPLRPGVESLNVAVAASIALFQAAAGRRRGC